MTTAGTQHPGESSFESPNNIDEQLSNDERWKLVLRIVASSGFQRAGQLRAMLQYITQFAILHEGDSLREYDIARDVLSRRSNFDPASDNIVRVQASHLRRKLDQYFAGEGWAEPVILAIPKGSYVPQFHAASVTPQASPQVSSSTPSVQSELSPTVGRSFNRSLRGVSWRALAFSLFVVLILLTLTWKTEIRSYLSPKLPSTATLILRSLIQPDGSTSVVLSDVSLAEIQTFLKADITIPEYTSSDFPHNVMDRVKDPAARETLEYIGKKRATSTAEASVAMAFLDELKNAGGHGVLRNARDLHVRDLGDGNLILIGSPRSNPWVSLFSNRTNFAYFEDNSGHYFLNAHPKKGELSRYMCNYSTNRSQEQVSYVDVALLPNLTNSGFVLLINGADVQANEAAANYLLHGRLPVSVVASLSRKDLRGFELLLKGDHLENESDSTIDIVSFRLMQD